VNQNELMVDSDSLVVAIAYLDGGA